MNQKEIIIIYPIDPYGVKFGGIETSIRAQIDHFESDFRFKIIGIALKGSGLKIGEWHNINYYGKQIEFFPVIEVSDPNKRAIIPLIARFTMGLLRWKHKIDFEWKIIVFRRLEPSYVLRDIDAKKVLFTHGDIRYFKEKHCDSKWSKFSKIYSLIEPFFIKQMMRVFIVSESGVEYYTHKYPDIAERFEFLPNFYNSSIFFRNENIKRSEVLQRYNIPGNGPIVLFVGRLELPKDPMLLLNSFHHITDKIIKGQLIVVGTGSLEQAMKQEVLRLNITNNVTFIGKKTQEEVAELMNISDLMLLTSAFEGIPGVILQALACGLPVVSTDLKGARMVVRDGISGKIVDSRNPEDIAEAALKLIENRLLPESCREAVSPYSDKKVFSFLQDEFRRLAGDQISGKVFQEIHGKESVWS